MNKKSIISITLGVLLIILGLVLIFGGNSKKTVVKDDTTTQEPATQVDENKVYSRITVYEQTGTDVINEIEIKDKEIGDKIKGFIDQLKAEDDSEMISTTIIRNVVIEYDNYKVGVQTGIEDYCLFSNIGSEPNILSKMPVGLMDWLKESIL